jgi:hypothetical protein
MELGYNGIFTLDVVKVYVVVVEGFLMLMWLEVRICSDVPRTNRFLQHSTTGRWV